MAVSPRAREEAAQLREAIELSKREMHASTTAAADSDADVVDMEAPPTPQPSRRKRGRPSTERASPASPPPPLKHVAAALSRGGRRPNYKEASDDDEFEAPTTDDEADAEAEGGEGGGGEEERSDVFESLLITEGEREELTRTWRERVGRGATQTTLERWFGVGGIPDEYYGLNGWLGRLRPGHILARRFIQGRHSTFNTRGLDDDSSTVAADSEVEGCFWHLYAVKGESYLHCRWLPEHHFLQFDDASSRITHFNKKRTSDEAELDMAFVAQQSTTARQQQASAMDEEKEVEVIEPPHASVDAPHQRVHAADSSTDGSSSLLSTPAACSTADQSASPPHSNDAPNTDSPPPSTAQSDADKEAADLAAFLAKEDERKRARMQDIALEREDIQRRRRLAPLFDTDWLVVDRVIDHRRKRKERRRKSRSEERTRKERLEELIERYQRAAHKRALTFIRAMQQSETHSERKEEVDGRQVASTDTTDVEVEATEEAMQDETDEAEVDDEDAPLIGGGSRVEYEFLVKWKKLPYEQCTWETFSFLSAAHIDAPQLATPLASPAPTAQSPSASVWESSPYLAAVRAYLDSVSRAAVRPSSWIVPHSRRARAAERRRESEQARQAKLQERRRRVEEKRQAKQQSESMTDEAKDQTDEETKAADEDELSMSHSSDTDDEQHDTALLLPPPPPASSALSALSSRPPVTSSMRFGPAGLTLRPYQVDGVNWIVLNWLTGRNSILADEMGLGHHRAHIAKAAYP